MNTLALEIGLVVLAAAAVGLAWWGARGAERAARMATRELGGAAGCRDRAAYEAEKAEAAADRAGECQPEEIISRARDMQRQARNLCEQTLNQLGRVEAIAQRMMREEKKRRNAGGSDA